MSSHHFEAQYEHEGNYEAGDYNEAAGDYNDNVPPSQESSKVSDNDTGSSSSSSDSSDIDNEERSPPSPPLDKHQKHRTKGGHRQQKGGSRKRRDDADGGVGRQHFALSSDAAFNVTLPAKFSVKGKPNQLSAKEVDSIATYYSPTRHIPPKPSAKRKDEHKTCRAAVEKSDDANEAKFQGVKRTVVSKLNELEAYCTNLKEEGTRYHTQCKDLCRVGKQVVAAKVGLEKENTRLRTTIRSRDDTISKAKGATERMKAAKIKVEGELRTTKDEKKAAADRVREEKKVAKKAAADREKELKTEITSLKTEITNLKRQLQQLQSSNGGGYGGQQNICLGGSQGRRGGSIRLDPIEQTNLKLYEHRERKLIDLQAKVDQNRLDEEKRNRDQSDKMKAKHQKKTKVAGAMRMLSGLGGANNGLFDHSGMLDIANSGLGADSGVQFEDILGHVQQQPPPANNGYNAYNNTNQMYAPPGHQPQPYHQTQPYHQSTHPSQNSMQCHQNTYRPPAAPPVQMQQQQQQPQGWSAQMQHQQHTMPIPIHHQQHQRQPQPQPQCQPQPQPQPAQMQHQQYLRQAPAQTQQQQYLHQAPPAQVQQYYDQSSTTHNNEGYFEGAGASTDPNAQQFAAGTGQDHGDQSSVPPANYGFPPIPQSSPSDHRSQYRVDNTHTGGPMKKRSFGP